MDTAEVIKSKKLLFFIMGAIKNETLNIIGFKYMYRVIFTI